MSIGSSVEELWLLILLLIPGLLGPPLLLGVGALLGRTLRLRPALFAPLFTLGILGLIAVGGSLYLDIAGRPVSGMVARKEEQVELRRQGDWHHRLHVELQYAASPLADGQRNAATSLELAATQFDRLRAGEPVQLRVLPIWRSLGVVTLADSSTATRLPWGWLAAGLVALGLGWLAIRRWRGYGVLAVVVCALLVAAGAPLVGAYRDWSSLTRPDARPLQAQATLRKLDEVTTIDPLPCRPGSGSRCARSLNTAFNVPQPYTIVQLSFVPQGARDSVLAVSAIDAGSVSLRPGDSVTLAYAPDAPRDAQIVGASHRHRWLNPLAAIGTVAAPLVTIVLVLIGVFALIRRSRVVTRKRQGS